MWNSIRTQLASGKERIKIEIDERKGNGKWYFTCISTDAVQELKKWLLLRQKIVERARKRFGYVDPNIVQGMPIFITNDATPYRESNFHQNYDALMRRNGLKKMPYEKVSHMFRKLFKSEASVIDRGIDRNVVEFWLGRAESVHGLDATGGTYDRNPEIREEMIEREYMKLDPYINIYSGVSLRERGLLVDEKEKKREAILNEFWNFLKEPANREGLRQLIEQARRNAE